MKVIHVIWGLPGGGKERRMLQLIKGLALQGEKQILVSMMSRCDYAGSFEEYADFIIVEGRGKLNRCLQFYKLLKKEKPDIVHLWQGLPLICLFLPTLKLLLRFKYVAGFIADAIPAKVMSFTFIANQLTYLFADAIVSNSKAGLISHKADYKKASVIYNGFDFGRFKSEGYDRDKFKESLGIRQRYIATMVARFSPAKDYKMFVDLAGKMRGNEDIAFTAAGHGPELDYFKAYCKEKGINNVYFLGFRSDVEKILMCSDIGLLFTNEKVHAEGVSNSIMESMAAGLPVIATDGGGTPEIIEDGKTGFIVEPGNSAKAAAILTKLLADKTLKKSIGESARDRVRTHFSLDAMTFEYLRLYKKLIQ